MHFKIHVIDVKNQLQNYIWLLEDTRSHEVVVIDPTEGQLVIDYCQAHGLQIKQIWLIVCEQTKPVNHIYTSTRFCIR